MPRRRMPQPDHAEQTRRHLRLISGREHIVLLGRAAAGIEMLLRVWGIRNQWIAIPANTCYIVLWAVLHSGNRPLLVDVDPRTGNLDPSCLVRLPVMPRAVIPCHLHGIPAPIEQIMVWARNHDVYVMEDCAQALCAASAATAIYSFGLGKVIDHQVGGALVTDDAALAAECARLTSALPVWNDHLIALTNQWHSLYWALHQHESANPRLAALYPQLYDIYAPLIAYQLTPSEWSGVPARLRELPANHAQHIAQAQNYQRLLGEQRAIITDAPLWKVPLLVPPAMRDTLLTELWAHGFHDVTRWYPSLQTMCAALAPASPQPPTPHADSFSASIINLPLGEAVNEAAQRKIVDVLRNALD
jgi:dTDP-4-amino-4,6-dideoxygalactose transaminase